MPQLTHTKKQSSIAIRAPTHIPCNSALAALALVSVEDDVAVSIEELSVLLLRPWDYEKLFDAPDSNTALFGVERFPLQKHVCNSDVEVVEQ